MDCAAIRDLVLQECRKPANIFGQSFFDQHLAVVAACGRALAERLGANLEIVEAAAYLHDISAVRDASTLAAHARASAEQARRLLPGTGCAREDVEAVARCIESHSTPVQTGCGSLEEVCLSNADAMSRIMRPAYWCYVAFGVRRQGFEEGRRWLLGLLEKDWNGLAEPAKELAGGEYAFSRELLGGA